VTGRAGPPSSVTVAARDWRIDAGHRDPQSRDECPSLLVRGRDHRDWLPQLDTWRAGARDAAALELLLDCIAAAEREAYELGCNPNATYTLRAAVIYRRRRDYAAEVHVLRRWLDVSMPSEEAPSVVAVRLVRARRLLAARARRDGVA
jgi:hypothetical protein